MAGHQRKSTVLIFSSLLLVWTAAGVTFNVNVEGDTEASVYQTQYNSNVSSYQQVNLTAENTGSIGCSFRLQGIFTYKNKTEEIYSPSKALWPGDSGLLRIDYTPTNHTGEVDAKLLLNYCDMKEDLGNFTFNVGENKTAEETIESTTLAATPEKAEIELETEKAVLVPSEKPDGWKVASARLEEGKTELEYVPTLFDSSREIKYTVLNQSTGELIGETRVKLEAEETWLDTIEENKWKILLLFSILVNLILVSHRRIRSAAERFKG